MTPAQLSRTVLHTLRGVVGDAPAPARVVIESPPRRGSGDYATGVAMQVARAGGQDAHDLAELLGRGLAQERGIGHVEVSGGGFLNVTLDHDGRAALVRDLTGPDRSAPDDPATDACRWAAATGATTTGTVAEATAAETTAATSTPVASLLTRTDASPLFRVQYAHARTRALLRNAATLGFPPEPGAGGYGYDAPAERALLALLADQQRLAESAGRGRLARHLTAVADAFREAAGTCPSLPRGDEKPGAAHRARLALTEATGTVLAGGLAQLGVTAPAHL